MKAGQCKNQRLRASETQHGGDAKGFSPLGSNELKCGVDSDWLPDWTVFGCKQVICPGGSVWVTPSKKGILLASDPTSYVNESTNGVSTPAAIQLHKSVCMSIESRNFKYGTNLSV
eukprot:TRINITY_DN40517_c0_g1_i1.p1 TRINITY_DN40517_c0_g1~~TRINITY_DN40517_c0_g1_i1.p1  ORF type:complete len:116 (+),score=7.99 TRINITY_DN40517_c0_g1_i1:311-658(+)